MRVLILLSVILALLALCHMCTAAAKACENNCVGIEDPNSQPVYAAVAEEEEQEEVTVANYDDVEVVLSETLAAAPTPKIKPFSALPLVSYVGGSFLIGSSCISGCSWFQFQEQYTRKPICSNCNKLIRYNAVRKVGGALTCLAMPASVINNKVSAAQLEQIKQTCAAQGCKCANHTITPENAKTISVYDQMVDTMIHTFFEYFDKQYHNYQQSVVAVFRANSRKCKNPIIVGLAIVAQGFLTRFLNPTVWSKMQIKLASAGINDKNADAKLADVAKTINEESEKARQFYQGKYNKLIGLMRKNCPALLL